MRTRRTLYLMFGLVLALGLTACAGSKLPAGYESLKTEANLVEGSKYVNALRDQYVLARQRGQLNPTQFAQAVKADQSLTAIWNQYIEAVRVKRDDAALWSQVIRATATLENLLMAWIPGYTPTARPEVLGK